MQAIIELNAHMIRTDFSKFLIELGAFAIFLAFVWVVWKWLENTISLKAGLIFFAVFSIVMGAMIAWGVSIPRVKQIQFCVNGPITIERIESVYDIVEIDGKLLTVRERT